MTTAHPRALQTASQDLGTLASTSGIVQFPLEVTTSPRHAPIPSIGKRQIKLETHHTGVKLPMVNITVGTPGQTVQMVVDTGSWHFWLNPNCYAADDRKYCESLAAFNASASTSLRPVTTVGERTVYYGMARARYRVYSDSVRVGSGLVINQRFGIASNSLFCDSGILGLAPRPVGADSAPWPHLIDNLVLQGAIQSSVFSMSLPPPGQNRGHLTFGGVDRSQFSGTLEPLPIVPGDGMEANTTRYRVHLNGFRLESLVTGEQVVSEKKVKVIIDTGSQLSFLSNEMVDAIWSAFPQGSVESNGSMDYLAVSCTHQNLNKTLDLRFGNATTIRVPYREFVIGPVEGYDNGCYLAIAKRAKSHTQGIYSLGKLLIQAAYVVFDQDNMKLWMAEARRGCASDLIAVQRGPDALGTIEGSCQAGADAGAGLVSTLDRNVDEETAEGTQSQSKHLTEEQTPQGMIVKRAFSSVLALQSLGPYRSRFKICEY